MNAMVSTQMPIILDQIISMVGNAVNKDFFFPWFYSLILASSGDSLDVLKANSYVTGLLMSQGLRCEPTILET